MKFVHLKAVVGAMALSIALAGTAQAQIALSDITYATSDDTNVDIGVSNVPARRLMSQIKRHETH